MLSTAPVLSLAIPLTDYETAALESRPRAEIPSSAISDGAEFVRT
jgi:hypothetical protein